MIVIYAILPQKGDFKVSDTNESTMASRYNISQRLPVPHELIAVCQMMHGLDFALFRNLKFKLQSTTSTTIVGVYGIVSL